MRGATCPWAFPSTALPSLHSPCWYREGTKGRNVGWPGEKPALPLATSPQQSKGCSEGQQRALKMGYVFCPQGHGARVGSLSQWRDVWEGASMYGEGSGYGETKQVASSPKRASRSGVTQLTPRTSSGQQRGLRMYAQEKGSQGEWNARK